MAVLINTIYFKANLKHKFDKKLTTKAKFININKGQQMVSMMYNKQNFFYYENQEMQMLEMPYVNDNYCFGIIFSRNVNILPNHVLYDIEKYIDQLDNYEKIDVYIPKFTKSSKINLVPELKKLNINDLFTIKSDLSGIAENIYVSEALHEAIIIVDKKGTEAAAVTTFKAKSFSTNKYKIFRADHSFIYYIRYKPSNILLFLGDYHAT